MKVFKVISWAFFALLSTSSADPNGWESSGGEIFRFAKNPWFVRNTSVVRYCVAIDSAGFSSDAATVKLSLNNAVAYWQREFKNAIGAVQHDPNDPLDPMTPVTALATQVFVEETCGAQTDLVLKFGAGVLSQDEKKHLGDFQSYIGISVRTEYDMKLMKAKGFIFIASDKGPNAYHNPGHLLDNAWKYPKLLEYILLHELGHVFGLPHSGSGLMSEVFPDQLLHKNMYTSYLALEPPSMFGSPQRVDVCVGDFGAFEPAFFQLPSGTPCLRIEPQASDPFLWDISSIDRKKVPTLAGYLRVQPNTGAFLSLQPAVIVHLPADQEVFAPHERALFSFLIGAFYVDINASGSYRTKTSLKPYPVFLQLRPDRIHVLGEYDSRLQTLVEYSPPTLFRLLFPPKGN